MLPGKLFAQLPGDVLIDDGRAELDTGELALVAEGFRDLLVRDEIQLDESLAEANSARALVRQPAIEVFQRDQALADQQLAEAVRRRNLW